MNTAVKHELLGVFPDLRGTQAAGLSSYKPELSLEQCYAMARRMSASFLLHKHANPDSANLEQAEDFACGIVLNLASEIRNQYNIRTQGDALDRNDDEPQMIVEQQPKGTRFRRMAELVGIAEFIGNASLLECKHIINELIDRTSTITGCATELENAACSLARSIEIDGDVDGDASDCLRAYTEGRDEL